MFDRGSKAALMALQSELAEVRSAIAGLCDQLRGMAERHEAHARRLDGIDERLVALESRRQQHEDRLNGSDERLESLETAARGGDRAADRHRDDDHRELERIGVRMRKLEATLDLQAEDYRKVALGLIERMNPVLRGTTTTD